jgi:DNA-binding NarL/FixJ family response regulator
MDSFRTTSVLLIDASKNQRTYWADQLKLCSTNYEIVEASDGPSGLDIYRSRRIDCVVLELSLPDQSGFQTLGDLVQSANRPQVAVIVLTHMTHRGISELATQHGAYACFVKRHTTGEDLDRSIQRAMAFVRQMPKEDRKPTPSSPSDSSSTEYDKPPR